MGLLFERKGSEIHILSEIIFLCAAVTDNELQHCAKKGKEEEKSKLANVNEQFKGPVCKICW